MIDIFGEPVTLYINKNYSVKTYLGGCRTLISFNLVILFCWLIGKDLFLKESPFNFQQTALSSSFKNITLNSQSFPIALSLQDINGISLVD